MNQFIEKDQRLLNVGIKLYGAPGVKKDALLTNLELCITHQIQISVN